MDTNNDEDFTCQACGAGFKTKEELEQHNKEAHPEM